MDVRELITRAYDIDMRTPCNPAFDKPDSINIVEFNSPRRNCVVRDGPLIIKTPRPITYAKETRSSRCKSDYQITSRLEAGIIISAIDRCDSVRKWIEFAYHPNDDSKKWQSIERLVKSVCDQYSLSAQDRVLSRVELIAMAAVFNARSRAMGQPERISIASVCADADIHSSNWGKTYKRHYESMIDICLNWDKIGVVAVINVLPRIFG